MDKNETEAEAIVTKNGKIEFVGSKQQAKKYEGNAKIFDYGNNTIYPGFMDGHMHAHRAGLGITSECKLERTDSYAQCVEKMSS